MQSIPGWLDAAAMRQDYLWFLLAAGWVTLWLLSRNSRLPALPALGLAVFATAIGEVAGMLLLSDSNGEPNLIAEQFGRLLACTPGLAILFAGTGYSGRPAGARILVVGVALAQGGLILTHLAAGWTGLGTMTLLSLAAGGLGGAWLRRSREADPDRNLWLALGFLAGAAPLFASSGLFAEFLGWPRRWLTASPVGIFSTGGQFILLGCAWRIWHRHTQARDEEKRAYQGSRQTLALLGLWLALGGLLVELSGRKAFDDFVASLQARNRTCLATMDRNRLAECLGPAFQIEHVRQMRNPAWKAYLADAPIVLTDRFLPLQEHLQDLWQNNPDFTWLLVTTLREPWLVTAVLPYTGKQRVGTVSVQREATAADRAAWQAKRGYVEGPAWSPRGNFLIVAEAITAPDGGMLGWLTVKVDSYRVLAAQAPARLLTCLTVALGAIVGGGAQIMRARGQAQRAARAQAEAAQAADRMKSALLAHVSHELRTPLQGILGYTELLARRPLDPEQQGWVQAQQRQGRLLLRLVNDLIDLGALQSGMLSLVPRPGHLASLVEETVLGLRARAHLRQLALEFESDPAIPDSLEFDPDRIRQIVINLVGNAIKFTERGGVAVRLRLEAGSGSLVLVEIAVADTGPGIDPAQQGGLFQPFTRLETDRFIEGAGLGLAMTHGLCRAMDGSLAVESDGESGSTFRARLGLRPAEPVVMEIPVDAPGRHQGLRVVIADDNTLVRELYRTHLVAQGATCVTVGDGREALRAVRTPPSPQVLLLDLSMPHVDGLEVSRQLRASGPAGLRIIGISAHGNPGYRERALAAGMDDFLLKPVALEDLSRCLQSHYSAPAGGLRPAVIPAALREQLREIFRSETPKLLTQLEEAFARGDWPVVEARAHHLKSSAWVLERHALADCCQALCAAAQAGDKTAAAELLAVVKHAARD